MFSRVQYSLMKTVVGRSSPGGDFGQGQRRFSLLPQMQSDLRLLDRCTRDRFSLGAPLLHFKQNGLHRLFRLGRPFGQLILAL